MSLQEVVRCAFLSPTLIPPVPHCACQGAMSISLQDATTLGRVRTPSPAPRTKHMAAWGPSRTCRRSHDTERPAVFFRRARDSYHDSSAGEASSWFGSTVATLVAILSATAMFCSQQQDPPSCRSSTILFCALTWQIVPEPPTGMEVHDFGYFGGPGNLQGHESVM